MISNDLSGTMRVLSAEAVCAEFAKLREEIATLRQNREEIDQLRQEVTDLRRDLAGWGEALHLTSILLLETAEMARGHGQGVAEERVRRALGAHRHLPYIQRLSATVRALDADPAVAASPTPSVPVVEPVPDPTVRATAAVTPEALADPLDPQGRHATGELPLLGDPEPVSAEPEFRGWMEPAVPPVSDSGPETVVLAPYHPDQATAATVNGVV